MKVKRDVFKSFSFGSHTFGRHDRTYYLLYKLTTDATIYYLVRKRRYSKLKLLITLCRTVGTGARGNPIALSDFSMNRSKTFSFKRPRISTCPPELSDLPSALSGVPQFNHLLEQTLLVGRKIY